MNDTRTAWPHPPGTASGPRMTRALANRFAAGDSIAALAHDYGITVEDAALAIRVEMRGLLVFADKIDVAYETHNDERGMTSEQHYSVLLTKVWCAIERREAPVRLFADPVTLLADAGFGE